MANAITLRKRIALVAVAALGTGLLSAVPASAATTTLFHFVTAQTISVDGSTSTTIAGNNNYVEIGAIADAPVGTKIRVELTNGTFADAATVVAGVGAGAVDPTATVTYNTPAAGALPTIAYTSSNDIYGQDAAVSQGYLRLRIMTANAGTMTAKVYQQTTDANTGVTSSVLVDTLTTLVASSANVGVFSAANSKAIVDASAVNAATFTAVTDQTISVDGTTPGIRAGVVQLTLKDGNNTAMPAGTVVSASVSGAGLVSLGLGDVAPYTSAGRSVQATTIVGTNGIVYATLWTDGTAGPATVTFSIGGTVFTAKTATFFGAAASLVVNVDKVIIANGANSAVLSLVAKDAAGNVVPNQSVTVTSSNKALIGDFIVPSASAADARDGVFNVAINAAGTGTGKVTLSFADTATGKLTATGVVTVSTNVIDSMTVTLDKASYAPGEKATLTVAGLDANGLPVADGTYIALFKPDDTGLGLSASSAVTSFFFVRGNVTFKNGSSIVSFFVPVVAGDFTISGTTSSTSANLTSKAKGQAVSVKATVAAAADPAAAALAKQVADLQASLTAMTTTVNSLMTAWNAQMALTTKALKALFKKLGMKWVA